MTEEELIFVEASETYINELTSFRQEMIETGSEMDGCFTLRRMEPEEYIEKCKEWSNPKLPEGLYQSKGNVIFCIRKSDMKMVGCMQLHYRLNENMVKYTGHVGYSVRPTERRKGYAIRMLDKAKDYLRDYGFEEIYVSCIPDNIASKKTILANGGEYVETVYLAEDDVNLDRFRIKL